jgi:hypothetical protein
VTHQLAHAVLAAGFWLSGIAIGYITAKRSFMADYRAHVQSTTRSRNLETTVDRDMGPWIQKSKNT